MPCRSGHLCLAPEAAGSCRCQPRRRWSPIFSRGGLPGPLSASKGCHLASSSSVPAQAPSKLFWPAISYNANKNVKWINHIECTTSLDCNRKQNHPVFTIVFSRIKWVNYWFHLTRVGSKQFANHIYNVAMGWSFPSNSNCNGAQNFGAHNLSVSRSQPLRQTVCVILRTNWENVITMYQTERFIVGPTRAGGSRRRGVCGDKSGRSATDRRVDQLVFIDDQLAPITPAMFLPGQTAGRSPIWGHTQPLPRTGK